MNKVILISGKQGSGKTTVARKLREHLLDAGHQVSVVKFADPIYRLHDAIWTEMRAYGYRYDFSKKDGVLLQLLGTEWGRKTLGDDAWVEAAQVRVEKYIASGAYVIIDDCRFENELAAFPDAYSIRLECSKEVRRERCEAWRDNDSHASETALDNSLSKFTKVIDTEHLDMGSVLAAVVEGL